MLTFHNNVERFLQYHNVASGIIRYFKHSIVQKCLNSSILRSTALELNFLDNWRSCLIKVT